MSEAVHTPWQGQLSCDLRKGALSVNADGLTLIDEAGVCWAIVFLQSSGSYDHVPLIVTAVNDRPTLLARVAELEAALRLYEDAITEAEAIFGGEYADHYGPMFELAMKARDARAALSKSGEAQ